MDLNEYQCLAQRTSNPDLTNWQKVQNGCYGMCGEAGECIDLLKKVEFQGHVFEPLKLLDELSDVLWYVAETAAGLGYTLEDVANYNINKLQDRYPKGFSAENSIHRPEYEGDGNDE